MEVLSALRLQLEWGVDEILLAEAQNRNIARPEPEPEPEPEPAPLAPPPLATKPAPRRAALLPIGPQDAVEIADACNSLEELRVALQNFTGCALRDTATQLVFADGVDDARVVLIGEAPGAEEDRAGKPFIGPAGQLLDKMLASIGLDRTKVRIINTVPWRPPGNRAPTDNEIAVCLPFLRRHIALVKPECLVLLGAVAAKAMLPPQTGNAGIGRLRGKWYDIEIAGLAQPVSSLATYHPAYLLRMPTAKRDSWHDLLALRHWLESQALMF
ncbi:MAG: uracil-DNA glycosylase [Acidocella sp. 20-57-95]|nr:MAG: uracil-DNA glycosylase [Acidocella sp. 20-57-95]OYV61693.1 MAG: uracil-DNA glycosylase [Acidocella sp. 21-58-7]HQT63258.1 uracil-DNA glycosylase [Acidocella sp.]